MQPSNINTSVKLKNKPKSPLEASINPGNKKANSSIQPINTLFYKAEKRKPKQKYISYN